MAKATGATKAQKPLSNKAEEAITAAFEEIGDAAENENPSKKTDIAASSTSDVKASSGSNKGAAIVPAAAPKASGTVVSTSATRKDFDFDGLVAASLGVETQLQSSADTFAATNQKWVQFSDHLVSATTELHRLRSVEVERDDLARLYADEKTLLEKTDAELREVKLNEAKANDRATKFEEICETIKERAFEIHAALQKSRVAEQDAQTELAALRAELTELKRVAQDDAAARIVGEARNKELQANIAQLEKDDAAARDRIGKLVEDNKALAGQVPQLLSERDMLRKQFQASERENARMLSERRVAGDRIADLENEIVTLRSDLGSLTAAPVPVSTPAPVLMAAAAPAQVSTPASAPAPVPAPVPVEGLRPTVRDAEPEELQDDDLDLVASLDLAFSEEDLEPATADEPKRKS